MYQRDKRRLVERILTGEEGPRVTPTKEDIQSMLGDLFASPSPRDDEPVKEAAASVPIMTPISKEEVSSCFAGMRGKAVGVDGITPELFLSVGTDTWALVFNVILHCRDLPPTLKRNRTTLLPKAGDLSKAMSWRPITISSIVLRALHKILGKRLAAAMNLDPRLQAFIPEDGLMANTTLLQTILKTSQKKLPGLSLVSLDLAKAFDSVSHHSTLRALKRQGLDVGFVEYIEATYNSASTSISCGEATVEDVPLNRGVKQGTHYPPCSSTPSLTSFAQFSQNT